MKYISIDGDDIGRKITSYYLSNSSKELRNLSLAMKASTENISRKLDALGFDIIFCAADGVVAATDLEIDFNALFKDVGNLAPEGVTFSAGVGENLKEAYVALISAKSNGKNCLHHYVDMKSHNLEIKHV